MADARPETKYSVKAAEWRLLDTGNPAFRPVGYADFGKNMQAEYSKRFDEDAETYWRRVNSDLALRRAGEMIETRA